LRLADQVPNQGGADEAGPPRSPISGHSASQSGKSAYEK
jgi:hypothetical protein